VVYSTYVGSRVYKKEEKFGRIVRTFAIFFQNSMSFLLLFLVLLPKLKRFRRCLSTVTQRWTTHHSQRHKFTRHSMDLHLANAQTQILTALIDTNENTIPSTVPRGTAANPDSPQQAPLLHSLPNIPPAIFNYTNNNNKNNNSSDRRNYINSDSNTPSTVQHSTNHFWDLVNTFYQPQESPHSRTRPNIVQPPPLSNKPAPVVRPYDAVTQCHLP
jgi:hypothetical protein